MNARQLDDLYGRSPAGAIPGGVGRGIALVFPGSRFFNGVFAQATCLFGWQGKIFDRSRRRLVNRITPLRIHAIEAEVYEGPSRFDGNACIVLDYSKTSLVARSIRDEIRNIGPGLYLGFAYWNAWRLIAFSLSFDDCLPAGSSGQH